MIRVQQIADLEARVLRAIDLIERLRAQNRTLSASLESAEARTQELEGMLENVRGDQQNVEEIIQRTLNKLDGLEDAWAEIQKGDAPAVSEVAASEVAAGGGSSRSSTEPARLHSRRHGPGSGRRPGSTGRRRFTWRPGLTRSRCTIVGQTEAPGTAVRQ